MLEGGFPERSVHLYFENGNTHTHTHTRTLSIGPRKHREENPYIGHDQRKRRKREYNNKERCDIRRRDDITSREKKEIDVKATPVTTMQCIKQ